MGKQNNALAKAPLLGKLAIKNFLITEQEFDEAMAACSESTNPEEALKEYFLSRELISAQNLKRLIIATKAIELRRKDIKFGTIAINKGLISKSVLDMVLEEQNQSFKTNKNPRLIGDMLVEAGIITLDHRNMILKIQNRLIKELKQSYENINKKPGALVKKPSDVNSIEPSESKSKFTTVEILKHGIKLEVTQDTLTALISKTEEFDDNINPEDIRELLIKKGIIFGIVTDDLLSGFIKSRGFKKKGFIVARGIDPIRGEDAKIEYFFDTDHLKAGGLSLSGQIDFKDRGIIPQVEKGTVLAEKTPLKESLNGKTIFGKELATNKAQQLKLKYGQGTKLSEDSLKIIATVNGYPKLTWAGIVVVNEEYIANGDIDYQTGHINYDGNVQIKGCIKNGFKVAGNDIKAQEIEGGIIHAQGDLNISNGINEAKIYAKGNIYAKFVHNSDIACLGNIYITKEIVDSKIETSGACIAKDGKIISCKITAKMGIFAKQLGTELSEPNIIRTGKDTFIAKELHEIKEKITGLIKDKNKQQTMKNKIIDENEIHHKAATKLGNILEKNGVNQQKISSLIDSAMQQDKQKDEIVKLGIALDLLKQEEEKTNKKLKKCFDRIEDAEKKLKKIEINLLEIQQTIEDMKAEKKHLSDWNDANPGDTITKVTGVIFPGTIVQGKYSEKKINEKLINVTIKELMYKDDNKRKHQYEMIIN